MKLKTFSFSPNAVQSLLVGFGLTVATFGTTVAQEAAPAEEKPSAEEKWYDNLKISGHGHSYYLYNLNNPGTRRNGERLYDSKSNEFGLGMAQLSVAYTNKKSEFHLDVNAGPGAELVNGGNGVVGSSILIQNMYFKYKFTDKLSFEVGRFGTHIGMEVIDATANLCYSYAYMFRYGPYYNTGLRARYQLNDKVGFMAGLVNNWDAIDDNNGLQSVVGQVSLAPVEGLNIYINGVYGNEGPSTLDSATGKYKVQLGDRQAELDLTATYALNDKISIGLNTAYRRWGYDLTKDTDTTNSWFGVALYGRYKINDMIGVGMRYEYFNTDKARSRVGLVNTEDGKGVVFNAITLVGDINLADGHVIIKPEVRFDASGKKYGAFVNEKGEATSSQTTAGMAFIYKF